MVFLYLGCWDLGSGQVIGETETTPSLLSLLEFPPEEDELRHEWTPLPQGHHCSPNQGACQNHGRPKDYLLNLRKLKTLRLFKKILSSQ